MSHVTCISLLCRVTCTEFQIRSKQHDLCIDMKHQPQGSQVGVAKCSSDTSRGSGEQVRSVARWEWPSVAVTRHVAAVNR